MKIHVLIVLALCALLTPPAQAQEEPADSLMVKERHRPFDIKNRGLRLLAKVAAGTVSGTLTGVVAFGILTNIVEDPSYEDTHHTVGILLFSAAIGCTFGYPMGVTLPDPHDSWPKTLLAGVIPGVAGYSLEIASENHVGKVALLEYVVPPVSSLIASEVWRKPPQDHRFSFGLAPNPDSGLSAVAKLRF